MAKLNYKQKARKAIDNLVDHSVKEKLKEILKSAGVHYDHEKLRFKVSFDETSGGMKWITVSLDQSTLFLFDGAKGEIDAGMSISKETLTRYAKHFRQLADKCERQIKTIEDFEGEN